MRDGQLTGMLSERRVALGVGRRVGSSWINRTSPHSNSYLITLPNSPASLMDNHLIIYCLFKFPTPTPPYLFIVWVSHLTVEK